MAGGWFPNLQCLNMRGYFAEPLFLSTPLYNEFKKATTYHIQLTPPALSHANDLMLLQNWEFSHKLNSSPCIQLWAPMNYNKWFIKSISLDSRVTSSYSSQHAHGSGATHWYCSLQRAKVTQIPAGCCYRYNWENPSSSFPSLSVSPSLHFCICTCPSGIIWKLSITRTQAERGKMFRQ